MASLWFAEWLRRTVVAFRSKACQGMGRLFEFIFPATRGNANSVSEKRLMFHLRFIALCHLIKTQVIKNSGNSAESFAMRIRLAKRTILRPVFRLPFFGMIGGIDPKRPVRRTKKFLYATRTQCRSSMTFAIEPIRQGRSNRHELNISPQTRKDVLTCVELLFRERVLKLLVSVTSPA